jgi:hypothetical protein
MESIDLWLICVIAFSAVFVLLVVLAAVMRLILSVFPQLQMEEADTAMIAAVSSLASTLYPGNTITKVEEIK